MKIPLGKLDIGNVFTLRGEDGVVMDKLPIHKGERNIEVAFFYYSTKDKDRTTLLPGNTIVRKKTWDFSLGAVVYEIPESLRQYA